MQSESPLPLPPLLPKLDSALFRDAAASFMNKLNNINEGGTSFNKDIKDDEDNAEDDYEEGGEEEEDHFDGNEDSM